MIAGSFFFVPEYPWLLSLLFVYHCEGCGTIYTGGGSPGSPMREYNWWGRIDTHIGSNCEPETCSLYHGDVKIIVYASKTLYDQYIPLEENRGGMSMCGVSDRTGF